MNSSRLSATYRSLIALTIIVTVFGTLFTMFPRLIDRLVYYPMPYPQGEWNVQSEIGAQDQWLTTTDGVQLHSWWVPNPGARFATLFLHGNAGNVTHRADHAAAVTHAGSAILILDYRGYGKSKGHPCERGLYLDAEAAYEKVVQLGYTPDRIILQGESIGTAVAVELARRRACAGLILESPLASLSQMAGTVVPVIGPLVARGFDTEKKISKIHTPVFIIHGDADEVVPFSQGRAVFNAANQPKEFWQVPNARHNDLLYVAGAEYIDRLRAFYDSIRKN